MAARRYEISLRVLKNISRAREANERNIFQQERRNFVPNHITLIYNFDMWLQQRDLFGASSSRKFGQEQKRRIKREVRGEEMETYSSPFDLPFLLLLLERSHHREFRHLTKPRPRQQRERQKTKGLMSKTTTLHVHHAFLCISLPSLHNYDVK